MIVEYVLLVGLSEVLCECVVVMLIELDEFEVVVFMGIENGVGGFRIVCGMSVLLRVDMWVGNFGWSLSLFFC